MEEEPEATVEGGDLRAPALPVEVLTEILARLPGKSVGRFRCASRGWCAMLSSDYFVDLHRRQANRPGHPRLLLAPADGSIYSWQPGGSVEKLMPDDFPGGVTVPLTKPCRGLILLRCTNYGGYWVTNPSTGAALALPDSEVPLKMTSRHLLHHQDPPVFIDVSYGLGYCEMRKEYKAVRLFSYPGEPPSCEVLVLDTPTYWRPAANQPPQFEVAEDKPGVFLNGYLHFLCHGYIVAFNISDETFRVLPVPPGFQDAVSVMTELGGCLCVCYGEPGGEDPYYVYMLRDYNEPQWENLCCIDRTALLESERMLLKSLWLAPLSISYTDGGQKIMFGTGTCKVFAIDTDGGAPEILLTPEETIIGSCEDDNIPVLGLFEESLLPVGRTIEEMVFSLPTTKAWSDILKWLPTRSVLELSLVCREWRALITTGRFIRSHVIYANLNKSPRIMFVVDPRFGGYADLEQFNDTHIPSLMSDVVCSQPCHGLNVGSCASWDFICNPAIGYCEHIMLDDNDGTFFPGRMGLGYNSEINKHAVVRIAYEEKNMVTRRYKLICKMRYVTEHDQQWREIDPPPRPIAGTPPAFVKDRMFWLVDPNLGPISARCEIVAFNVLTDEFEVLQGPPCNHKNGPMTILQLQGSLCVSHSDQSVDTIDIWIMNDFDIWTLKYHIELQEFSPDYLAENTTPLAIDPKDGRILLNTGYLLGYYDPETAELETIYQLDLDDVPDLDDGPDLDMVFCPIICQESLFCPLGPF
ncbi:hypothetical protein ACP4OV_010711 [Aristida adscensionis]